MHAYRTHNCAQLSAENVGETVRLSGWINRKRDHPNVLFIDLRDHFGITQIVVPTDSSFYEEADQLGAESVITITGPVRKRSEETINPNLSTGDIENYSIPSLRFNLLPRTPRCQCLVSWSIQRKFASNTASSICAVRPCTATLCCCLR